DNIARFSHCVHHIGLPRKKGGKLDDSAHFVDGMALMGFVYFGNDGDAELCFDFFKNLSAFFQAYAAIGMDRRAVCLVERGFKDI
ncbi:hypothetical protein Q0N24_14365, partial [Staphylococcus aureus]|nr:hypothetical protein [Staphylococcus aureus]